MKAFTVLSILCAVTLSVAAEDYCYNDVVQACKSTAKKCKFLTKNIVFIYFISNRDFSSTGIV